MYIIKFITKYIPKSKKQKQKAKAKAKKHKA